MAKGSKSGFTLIEMSFVLIIIGLVIMIVFPALKSIQQSTQNKATQTNLDALINASAAYVQANGCLPCPTPPTATATATSAGIGRVRGDTNTDACGTCAMPEGVAPFVSLGLSMRTAKDGWGNWITMRVDPALTANFGSTPPASVCLSSDPTPCVRGESRKGLCQDNLPTTNRITVRNETGSETEAAIIFVSHGLNGRGAYRLNKTGFTRILNDFTRTCSTMGAYEHCNVNNDTSFTDAAYTTSDHVAFDDRLRFLGRNALVTYLGNAACQTAW